MLSVSLFDSQPSSTSGTKRGAACPNTRQWESYFFMAAIYAQLAIVALVPITPILLFFVVSTAALAPASITPIISMSKACFISFKARAEAVLHATTIIFTFFLSKKAVFSFEKLIMVSLVFVPYGVLAVSPR